MSANCVESQGRLHGLVDFTLPQVGETKLILNNTNLILHVNGRVGSMSEFLETKCVDATDPIVDSIV